ncbi:MAG TPA: SPFH domain-containing protein [Ktedonobacteraceae bacterium]|nr:SPFH domain-containing protein [Ktedonobacteraceae bacterium]
MTSEQDNSRASWSDSNTVSWDADSDLMDIDDPSTPPLQDDQDDQQSSSTNTASDDDEWEKPPLFGRDSLLQLARQLSPVLVPLPFAILVFLFTLPAGLKGQTHIPAVPLAILLLALVVVQGTFLYYAGSNDSLWTLYTVLGYALFLLVGVYALFGLEASLLLFIVLLVIGIIMGGRAVRQIPEGRVALVFSFGRYARTLFPGLNFILPWEKIEGRLLNTQETTWTSPPVRVNISRDQDVEIVATLTYQLTPEDAHIAALNMQDWQETLHQHFIGTIKSVVKEFSPADFVAWSHNVHTRAVGAQFIAPNGEVDPTSVTRWDRLNAVLRRRSQDQMAMRGILINLVHIQDITLIPHLTPVGGPPPGLQARPVDMGAARGPAPAQQPRPVAMPAPAAPVAAKFSAPPPAMPTPAMPVPKPDMFETMIQMYNSVREGRITDPNTILSLASRFNVIASDPEASQKFDYDSERAASNLYERARVLKAAEAHHASDPGVPMEVERPSRHPSNDNLTAGG